MAILLGLILVGMVIPQADRLTPAQRAEWLSRAPMVAGASQDLGLDRIFSQPYFLALVGALAVSVTVCTSLRVLRRKGGGRVPFLTASAAARRGLEWRPVPAPRDHVAERVGRCLGRSALAVSSTGDTGCTSVSGTGGRYGFWGSVLFHVALLLVVAGAVAGALTTFSADLVLTEGQTLELGRSAFLDIRSQPAIGEVPSGFAVALDDLDFAYDRGQVVEASAAVRVIQGDAVVDRATVRVNQPLDYRGLSLLLDRPGYSVRVAIRRGGTTVDDAFVTLGEKVAQGYVDRLVLPDGRKIEILAVGDARRKVSLPAKEPLLLRDPAAYVRLDGSGGPFVGPLRPGQSATVAGLTLTVQDVRLYSTFLARKSDGRVFLYVGMWLAILGVVIRFLDPERWVAVALRDGSESGTSEVAVLSRGRYGRLGLGRAERALEAALAANREGVER